MPPLVPIVILIAVLVAVVILVVQSRTQAATPEHSELLAIQNQWRAPGELLAGPVPRAVRLTGQAKLTVGGALLALVFGLGAGGVVTWMSMRETGVQQLLDREGVGTDAQVLRKWEVHGKSTTRYVIYAFETGGRTYRRRAVVPQSVYQRVREGDHLPVRYAASDPATNRLLSERQTVPIWLGYVVSMFFALLPWLIVRPVLIQRKVLAWGQPAGAMVVRIVPVKGGKSVAYWFLDRAANVVKGSTVVNRGRVPGLRETVTVVFDEENPRRNTLYPAPMAKISQQV